MKDYTTKKVGSFQVKSGSVMISDPCYKIGTWCQGVLKNVKKGKWNAIILKSDEGSWGSRVAVLIAYHDSFVNPPSYGSYFPWHTEGFEVGVDSGQGSIVDLKEFHSNDDEYDNINSWYRRVCDSTDDQGAGIIDDSGVTSSSGYGDGGYVCKTISEKGKVTAIMIDYGLLENENDKAEDNDEEDKFRWDE